MSDHTPTDMNFVTPHPAAPTPDPSVAVTIDPVVNGAGTTTGQTVTQAVPFASGTSGLTVRDFDQATGTWGAPRPDPFPRRPSEGLITGAVPPSGDNPQRLAPPADGPASS